MGFFNNKTIEDEPLVKELRSRIAKLELNNGELLSRIDADKSTIEAFAQVKQGYETRLQQLSADHTKQVEQLKLDLATEKQSVNRKVNKTLARIGVNDFAPEEITQTGTMNAKDVYEKWQSLKGYEKGKYFKANEPVINSFLKNLKQ